MHYSYIWNNSAFNERMMSRLLSMQAFERVSDEEGFAAAGRAPDMSLPAVTNLLNTRPRKTLGWKTPTEALNEYLKSIQQFSVATTG